MEADLLPKPIIPGLPEKERLKKPIKKKKRSKAKDIPMNYIASDFFKFQRDIKEQLGGFHFQ